MIPLSNTFRVVAADKKIAGLVVVGFVAAIWCILMQFPGLFSMLYTVHIHAVSQKKLVFSMVAAIYKFGIIIILPNNS